MSLSVEEIAEFLIACIFECLNGFGELVSNALWFVCIGSDDDWNVAFLHFNEHIHAWVELWEFFEEA